MSVEAVSFGWVERLPADVLELESPHLRVEEDLQEVEVVFVCRLCELDPSYGDLVLGSFVLSVKVWQLLHLL